MQKSRRSQSTENRRPRRPWPMNAVALMLLGEVAALFALAWWLILALDPATSGVSLEAIVEIIISSISRNLCLRSHRSNGPVCVLRQSATLAVCVEHYDVCAGGAAADRIVPVFS